MAASVEHSAIELGAAARVVVVADSHSKPHPNAVELIAAQKPVAILHAGDIGRLDVLDTLDTVAPTLAVRGNIDGHGERIPDQHVIDMTTETGATLRILLIHIAVYGPRLRKDARVHAQKHSASLVVCGHSHVPLLAEDGNLTVFNPGSFGPRRFQLPITFGVLEVAEGRLSMSHLDCETGAAWLPP